MDTASEPLSEARSGVNSDTTMAGKHFDVVASTTDLIEVSRMEEESTSGLFRKLPWDVRRLVYEQLLLEISESLKWHIISHSALDDDWNKENGCNVQKICQPCIVPVEHEWSYWFRDNTGWGENHMACRLTSLHGDQTKARSDSRQREREEQNIASYLNLMLCCRQSCQEAAEVLFSTITFSFVDLFAISRFIATTPIQSLNCLRKLHLSWLVPPMYLVDFKTPPPVPSDHSHLELRQEAGTKEEQLVLQKRWESLCHGLSTMKSLDELYIILYDDMFQAIESELLKPLQKITIPNNFVLQLPWAHPISPIETATPYELRRPTWKEDHWYAIPSEDGMMGGFRDVSETFLDLGIHAPYLDGL